MRKTKFPLIFPASLQNNPELASSPTYTYFYILPIVELLKFLFILCHWKPIPKFDILIIYVHSFITNESTYIYVYV